MLSDKTHRRKYLLVTLLIQIPLSVVFHFDAVNSVFDVLAELMRYPSEHTRACQAWQFLWMLNYYLPVYLWSRVSSSVRRV